MLRTSSVSLATSFWAAFASLSLAELVLGGFGFLVRVLLVLNQFLDLLGGLLQRRQGIGFGQLGRGDLPVDFVLGCLEIV